MLLLTVNAASLRTLLLVVTSGLGMRPSVHFKAGHFVGYECNVVCQSGPPLWARGPIIATLIALMTVLINLHALTAPIQTNAMFAVT